MATYGVRYYEAGQRAVFEAELEASSEDALRADAAAAGRIILGLHRHSGAEGGFRRERRGTLRHRRLVSGTGDPAGGGHDRRGSARDPRGAGARHVARDGACGIAPLAAGGASAVASDAAIGVFPAVLVASVTASERTGTLTGALEDYRRYDEMVTRLTRQVISAAIYPVVVALLGFLVALFLLLYVIPRFSRMYVDFQGSVSVPTRLLMMIGGTLHEHAAWVAGGLLGAFLATVWACRAGHAAKAMARLVEGTPPLRRQWDHFRYAKLYQALALMFRGGYTLDEALAVSAQMKLGTRIEAGIGVARGEIAQGRGVARAFGEAGLTDDVTRRLLAVAERSGGFDTVLQAIADRRAGAFATFVERAMRVVEPLLLLLVALVVGGIVVTMYMPIFDIASGVR